MLITPIVDENQSLSKTVDAYQSTDAGITVEKKISCG